MMTDAQPEHLDALEWFEKLYGSADEGWLTLFSQDRQNPQIRTTDWAPVADLGRMASIAAHREPRCCVWFGVATRKARLDGGKRGGREDCVAIPGFWLDIDVKGPGHEADHRLARDRSHGHDLIAAFPLPPTAVIESGGGLQAWWLFNEMVALDDHARTQLSAWGATWLRLGEAHDMDLDNVFEAARVMRLPGTTNRKAGLARPVTLVGADWGRRYGLDDIEGYLDQPSEVPHHPGNAVPYIGPERPGDAFSARHAGGEVLALAGFTFMQRQRNGDEKWCRPGKDPRDGLSAMVYANDGHTTIYSDTVTAPIPGMEKDTPYRPHQLYAFLFHGGDFSASASDLRKRGYGSTERLPDLADMIGETLKGAKPSATKAPLPTPTRVQDWPEPTAIPTSDATPEVPVDAFPGWMADQIRNVANQLMCDPMLPAMFGLGALAVASMGHVNIKVRAGELTRSTGLYLAAAGPPASGKSPALSMMFDPVREHEARMIAAALESVARAEALKAIAEKRAKEAVDNAARTGEKERKDLAAELKVEAASMVVPPAGELVTSDITPERVATLMVANEERIAIVSDESGVLDIDRYGDKTAGKKMDLYLQGFSGEPAVVHRQTAPTLRLRHPLMSIVAGVQPEPLAMAMSNYEFRTRGLGSRFLTATTTVLAENTDIDLDVWDHAIGEAYADRLGRLAAQWASWQVPAVLTLDNEARRRFSEWASELRSEQLPGGRLEGEGGWVSKMRSSVMRIAALFHLADGAAHSDPITAPTLERAIELGSYFVGHHTREVVDHSAAAKTLLSALCRLSAGATGPFVARRDLARLGPKGLRKFEQYAGPLELLIECGLVRLVGVLSGRDQQVSDLIKRASAFEVHPDAGRLVGRGDTGRQGRQTKVEVIESTSGADSVAPVAPVAYRDFETPPSSSYGATGEGTPGDRGDRGDTICTSVHINPAVLGDDDPWDLGLGGDEA